MADAAIDQTHHEALMHRLGYMWRVIACGLLHGIKSDRGWDQLFDKAKKTR